MSCHEDKARYPSGHMRIKWQCRGQRKQWRLHQGNLPVRIEQTVTSPSIFLLFLLFVAHAELELIAILPQSLLSSEIIVVYHHTQLCLLLLIVVSKNDHKGQVLQ